MIVESLEKLLREESSKVLLDASSLAVEEPILNDSMIFTANFFDELDVDELYALIESAEHYRSALQSDKLMVIPQVVAEWSRLENSFTRHNALMLGIITKRKMPVRKSGFRVPYARSNIRILEGDKNVTPRRKQFYQRRRQKSEKQELFEQVIRQFRGIRGGLNSHLFPVSNYLAYQKITDLIIDLNEVRNIKKGSSPKGRFVYQDLHTDEALVGAALYLSLCGEQVIIATRDTDIDNLLVASFNLLRSTSAPNLYQLIERLRANPVKICLTYSEGNKIRSTEGLHIANTQIYGNITDELAYRERIRQVTQMLLPVGL